MSSSVCGVAAPRYCGGFIGLGSKAKRIVIDNSYTSCVFDAVSNASKFIWQLDYAVSTLGFSMPDFEANT